MPSFKILCVHGLGDHRNKPWAEEWEAAIRDVFPAENDIELEIVSFTYDDIFEDVRISPIEATVALGKLLGSGIATGVSNLFGRPRSRSRGFMESLRWSAGYVVAWLEDEEFKARSRARVFAALAEHKPDVLVAHSLGTLVTYNALLHEEAAQHPMVAELLPRLSYITLGSQLGNPFVCRNLTGGRLVAPALQQWFHLYNAEDDVFTAPIKILDSDHFQQVDTFFDIAGWTDHSAVNYLRHPNTTNLVWTSLAGHGTGTQPRGDRPPNRLVPPKRKPRRRALLIGINDYPDPTMRLSGCVNDVFLISSVLQELEFTPEQIRVCLNHRATAEGILSRMDWLIEDVRPGDELVFYFSGHGAQLPAYNAAEVVDHMDETLVPYDFDWSPRTCVSDDQIFSFYSQLPYDTRLFMIFDCCHSGGIHRGPNKIRGVDAPDDIRHRSLQWNKKLQMWEHRRLETDGNDFIPQKNTNKSVATSTHRLGRASILRPGKEQTKSLERKLATVSSDQPREPYLPVILQACQESQYAYEYRHGATSYGAFTFSLSQLFREHPDLSLRELKDAVAKRLQALNYEQQPAILGPSAVVDLPILSVPPIRKTKKRAKKRRKK